MNEYTKTVIENARREMEACDAARDQWSCDSRGAREAQQKYEDARSRFNLLSGKTSEDVRAEQCTRLLNVAITNRYSLRVAHDGCVCFCNQPICLGREEQYEERLVAAGYVRVDSVNNRALWIPSKL